MSRVQLAKGVVVFAREDDVFVEFRDENGRLISLAGLTVEAAAEFNERVTDACVEALNNRRQAMAAARNPGGVH